MRLEARRRTRLAEDAKLGYGVCSTVRSLTSIPLETLKQVQSQDTMQAPLSERLLENHKSDKLKD
jgi:hypothetical protein